MSKPLNVQQRLRRNRMKYTFAIKKGDELMRGTIYLYYGV